MSCISPPGPWPAEGGKQGDTPVAGRSQLQAEQAKVMLFPDLLLPIPWSPACSCLSVRTPWHGKGGRGGLSLELLVWPPQQPPFTFVMLPHPWPAASSPLGYGSSKYRCSECTCVSSLLNGLPFFCTLLQSILQALWSVQILPCRVNQGPEGGKK